MFVGDRAGFARVCVRVDLSKPLCTRIMVAGEIGWFYHQFGYGGISNLCFICVLVGHANEIC